MRSTWMVSSMVKIVYHEVMVFAACWQGLHNEFLQKFSALDLVFTSRNSGQLVCLSMC